MNIVKSVIDKLPIPAKSGTGQTGQKRYYDDKLKGFGLRITSGGAKTFFVEKLINRKLRRIKVGRYGELTVEQARKKAQVMLGQIAEGIDPVAEKQSAVIRQTTLHRVMEDYIQARKTLKSKTLYDYHRVMEIAFAEWRNKPFVSITKDQVEKHHRKLGQKHGEAYANLAMRVLRALFNFAAGKYEDAQGHSLLADNPVKRLSQTRAWYRIECRKSFIKRNELESWYQGVIKLENETLRDYLLLILFTGLRRQEAAKLRWNDIDFKEKTLTISETKNNEKHTLPLSEYLFDLLARRRQRSINEYVFPGTGKGGYIIEPRKQIAKVIKSSGIAFTVHDLRRTFITVAESLDIAAYALKRLINHKMNNDVTAGYIVADVERLRKPMRQISSYLLQQMGVEAPGEIISFQGQSKASAV